jgi:hypothetical protein
VRIVEHRERGVVDPQVATADGHLSQAAYDAAHGLLGDAGVVELVALCGYYTTISFLLNAFAVALPPGVQPMWPGSQASECGSGVAGQRSAVELDHVSQGGHGVEVGGRRV